MEKATSYTGKRTRVHQLNTNKARLETEREREEAYRPKYKYNIHQVYSIFNGEFLTIFSSLPP